MKKKQINQEVNLGNRSVNLRNNQKRFKKMMIRILRTQKNRKETKEIQQSMKKLIKLELMGFKKN